MSRLNEKTAFITGGAAGIGRGIALTLAAKGATVAIVDIDEEAARQTAQDASAAGGRGHTYQCDVSNRAQVFDAMAKFTSEAGGLDVLVNNAVAFHYAPLVDMPEDKIHRMLDVGIKGAYWATQAATPHLIARGGGSIVNMSSVAVFFAIKNAAVYSSIKGALDAFTRQQAVELAPHKIRVNAIAPGPVSTPGANSVIDEPGWGIRRSRTPIGRIATVEDIGAAVAYLTSDEALSISGVTLKIDGAITIAGT